MSLCRAGKNKIQQKSDTSFKKLQAQVNGTLPPEPKKKKTGRAKKRSQFNKRNQGQDPHINSKKNHPPEKMEKGGKRFQLRISKNPWTPNSSISIENWSYEPWREDQSWTWYWQRTHHQDKGAHWKWVARHCNLKFIRAIENEENKIIPDHKLPDWVPTTTKKKQTRKTKKNN